MAKIAAIDDSQSDLEFLADLLVEMGHDVSCYSDVAGIEEVIAGTGTDLVLLDIVMPDRSGYEILRKLAKRPETQGIPVVLVSSKGSPADIAWGKRQGAADYLVKPYDGGQLQEVLGRVLS